MIAADEFQWVRDVLFGRESIPADLEQLRESCHRRLADATRVLRVNAGRVGGADLAVLVRHALRREHARQGGGSPALPVHRDWPRPPDGWAAFGLRPRPSWEGDYELIEADPWVPGWLGVTCPDESPEGPLVAAEPRRHFVDPGPADPFLGDVLAHRGYRCPAQRQAVRATLAAPPGSTLTVILPTGAGKSLCAQLPALLHPDRLTVVVVPTTTLALDQERALAAVSALGEARADRVLHPTAHVAGGDPAANAEIRRRIRRGLQRVVFTSPEALLEPGLAEAVYTAARAGQLDRLVVDEAHIVDQWGDEFRAAFQELAGLRRDLLAAAPGLRTLLLSATITEGCLDTLETLFGDPGPFRVCDAVQLRPEPEYWVAHAPAGGRTDLLLDALRHLPRPLILYVARKADAAGWLARLRERGFRRAAGVTGDTDTPERAAVIRDWQEHRLDLVVATSAFGMGMDKEDVRCVIHACIPESIDRFYQEVGRGGRDGRASLSLAVTEPTDWPLAERLNRRTVITTEYGLGRWREMYRSRVELPGGRLEVPLDAVATYRFGETDGDTRLNMAWNARTLTLMARAGLIRLDAEAPREFDPGDGLSEAEREARFAAWRQAHVNRRVLREQDLRHTDEGVWRTVVEASRARTERQAGIGLDLMRQALAGRRCLRDVLAVAYTIPPRGGDRPRAGVEVAPCCGGCPACRPHPHPPAVLPEPPPPWDYDTRTGGPTGRLADVLDGVSRLAVFDDKLPAALTRPGRERDLRFQLLMRLVSEGVRTVLAPPEVLEVLRPVVRRVPGAVVFFADEWRPLLLPRVPTLVLRPDGRLPGFVAEALRRPDVWTAPLLVWAPPTAPDPARPDRPLAGHLDCPTYRSFDALATEMGGVR